MQSILTAFLVFSFLIAGFRFAIYPLLKLRIERRIASDGIDQRLYQYDKSLLATAQRDIERLNVLLLAKTQMYDCCNADLMKREAELDAKKNECIDLFESHEKLKELFQQRHSDWLSVSANLADEKANSSELVNENARLSNKENVRKYQDEITDRVSRMDNTAELLGLLTSTYITSIAESSDVGLERNGDL